MKFIFLNVLKYCYFLFPLGEKQYPHVISYFINAYSEIFFVELSEYLLPT